MSVLKNGRCHYDNDGREGEGKTEDLLGMGVTEASIPIPSRRAGSSSGEGGAATWTGGTLLVDQVSGNSRRRSSALIRQNFSDLIPNHN